MPTQTGTLKAGNQLVIDSIGSQVDYDVSVTGYAVDFKRIQQKSTLSLGPYKVDCSYSVTINSGSPSIYKVQPNGQREYTAATLPDPAIMPIGQVVNVDGQEIQATDGIWQGKRRAVFVKTGSEADSAFNTLQIQTAINLGGVVEIVGEPGSVYVDKSVNNIACLVHPSFTTLVVPDNIRITQAANQKVPLIVSKSVADHINGLAKVVTLSWASGSSFTVTSVAHGKSVGDYVSIYKTSVLNTDPIQFAGTFMIRSVVNADSFTCGLYRGGVTAPTNTTQWAMVDSTVSAKLHGGKWDYNGAVNSPTGGTLQNMCSIYAFMALCELNPGTFYNTKKYCMMTGCDYGSYIARCDGDASTGSDGVKVYGPAVGTRVGRITGSFHDDCFSSQAYEAEAYAGYRVCWGDVLNVHVDEITATSTTAGAVVYTNAVGLGHTDNVTFGSITSNAPVRLIGQSSLTGDIGFVNFGKVQPRLGCTNGFYSANVAASHVKIHLITDSLSNCSTSGFLADLSSGIVKLELKTTVIDKTATASGWINIQGLFTQVILSGIIDVNSTNVDFFKTGSNPSAYIRDFKTDNASLRGVSISVLNGPTTQQVFTFNDCFINGGVLLTNNATSQAVRVRTNSNTVRNNSTLVKNGSASITTMVSTGVDNYFESGSVATNANGGTISAWS